MIDGAQPAGLTDRCALVVGASRGIGAAAAMTLAAPDARVGLSTRSDGAFVRSKSRYERLVPWLTLYRRTSRTRIRPTVVVGEVSAELGPVDVLVHATGLRVEGPFEDLSDRSMVA